MNSSAAANLRWTLLGCIILLYAVSFFLPAASSPGQLGPIRVNGTTISEGGQVLPPVHLSGFQAFDFAMRAYRIDWFANPVFWLGLIFLACRRWLLCGIAGAVALTLGLLTMLVFDAQEPELQTTWRSGYWTWLASMVVLTSTGWAGWYLSLRNRNQDFTPANPPAGSPAAS